MDPNNLPPQSFYMRYEGPFTEEFDRTFMEALAAIKKEKGWHGDDIPDEALKVAKETVNYAHGARLTKDDVQRRKWFMMMRYRTFKRVANFKGAQPDFPNNIVYASDEIWREILKENAFAAAYRDKGDPEWRNLQIVFGGGAVKKELSKSRINVSSNSSASAEDTKTVNLSDEDDEVTSPMIKIARRKLFNQDDTPEDTLSSSSRFPPKNVFPGRYVAGARHDGHKHGSSSSCASCSPAKFDWGPF